MPVSEEVGAPWRAYCGPSSGGEEEPSVGPRVWRPLQGFHGPYYLDHPSAQEVVLLEESIGQASSQQWRAWGLVRNESNAPAGATVTATLIGVGGAPLGSFSTEVEVSPLRPGEPGPFQVTSDVATAAVERVEWAVEPAPPGPGRHRAFLIRRHWTLPFGDRERATAHYEDPSGPPPYPFVLAGDVEGLRGVVVNRPVDVVAAWVDEDLRVRWVARARAGTVPYNPSSAAQLPMQVKPRVPLSYYLAVTDPEMGPRMTALSPILWVVGQ